MHLSLLALLPLIAPASLLLYAVYVLKSRPTTDNQKLKAGALPGLLGILGALSGIATIYYTSEVVSPLLGWAGLGFSVRIDALSIMMLTMIALLGFVIMRFSANYMDGDPRKHVFMSRMAVTIASVELLVLANNLGQILFFWIITSICLHYLLVFYRHRPQAVAAARKKFIVARLGDISLLMAVVILYNIFNTGDLTTIFAAVENGSGQPGLLTMATALLVFAAVLKSAQFPSHGWLIEVVETPTPVSALLHAGLLNAGPFLMVRMSYLLAESTSASVMLILIGGFTALIASVVYLTQPSIKVSLGYSSVAHMGFSLLLSGLGLYAAAILHIVAHSFYKGHAFLSSGSMVETARAQHIRQSKRQGSPILIAFSFITSAIIFIGCSYLWGLNLTENFSQLFIGTVIVLGLSQLFVQVIDSRQYNFMAITQAIVLSLVVSVSFLSFEHAARSVLSDQLPIFESPGTVIQVTAYILLAAYVLVVFIQLLTPVLPKAALTYRLGIHIRNGFYANVLFDRVIGSLKPDKFKWANLSVKEEVDEVEINEPQLIVAGSNLPVNN